MEFLPQATSLVVAGRWNSAILTPPWLGRHIFELPANSQFQVDLEMDVLGFGAPRYTINGIRIRPSGASLELQPVIFSLDALDQTERCARLVLQKLSHTPVQAIGFNFECIEPQPSQVQLAPFTAANQHLAELAFPFESRETKVTASLEFGGRVLNFTRSFSAGGLRLAFNFHYQVVSAEDGLAKLQNGVFRANLESFRQILTSLYDFDPVPQLGAENVEQLVN